MRRPREPQPHEPPPHAREVALLLLKASQLQLEAVRLLHDVLRPDDTPPAPEPRDDLLAGNDVRLTPRERQVLALLGQGMTNLAISQALDISAHTVRTHLQAIFRKLGASQRTEALVLAIDAGLLEGAD